MTPERKSSVKTTEDAQFGIRPTNAAIKGEKIPALAVKEESVSSPMKWSARPIKNEKMKMKKVICAVWIREERKMPFSQ